MLPFVACISCGYPIGYDAPLYRHMLRELVASKVGATGTRPQNAAMDALLQTCAGEILDLLGLKNMCCRMHTITAMTMADLY